MSDLIVNRVTLTRKEIEDIYNVKKILDEKELLDELMLSHIDNVRFVESPQVFVNATGKPWYRKWEKKW